MATVQFSFEEWNDHLAKLNAAQADAAKARQELASVRVAALEQAGHNVERISKLVDAATTIVTFAAGNLPPEVTKHWPADALREFASHLDALPNFDDNKRSLQGELIKLADEAHLHNITRAQRAAAVQPES